MREERLHHREANKDMFDKKLNTNYGNESHHPGSTQRTMVSLGRRGFQKYPDITFQTQAHVSSDDDLSPESSEIVIQALSIVVLKESSRVRSEAYQGEVEVKCLGRVHLREFRVPLRERL